MCLFGFFVLCPENPWSRIPYMSILPVLLSQFLSVALHILYNLCFVFSFNVYQFCPLNYLFLPSLFFHSFYVYTVET